MGQGSGCDADLLKKYKEVCADLNLDKAAADEALQSFQRIGINYTLEVSSPCRSLGDALTDRLTR